MNLNKILPISAMLLVVLMAGCKKDADSGMDPLGTSSDMLNLKSGEHSRAFVVSTSPTDGATSVPVNTIITANFNPKISPAQVATATFTVKKVKTGEGDDSNEGKSHKGHHDSGESVSIPGTITYTDFSASFTPASDLEMNTIYMATVKIKSHGHDDKGKCDQKNSYSWRFNTGAGVISLLPTVTLTDPLDNATAVAVNKVVTVTFSEAMDALSVNASTFILQQGTVIIAGTVAYSGLNATFTSSVNLDPNQVYTGTVTTGAKNVAGNQMANDFVWSFNTNAGGAQQIVDLGSAMRFGILAGVGVSNNAGFSVINNMDVGISPGLRSSVTGFPPATIVNGAIYASDDIAPTGVPAMLTQAKLDLTAAYLYAEGATSPAPATVSGDQGGKTLAPGIYKSTSTLLIQSGDLTLDAQGDPNAVWIFQVAAGFTTVGGAGGSVILSGGAQASNVYWQVGSSATIGDFTAFKGNVLALTSITMNSGATAVGRMLAINGAVVMTNTNTISKP